MTDEMLATYRFTTLQVEKSRSPKRLNRLPKNSLQEGHGFGNHGFGAAESHISRKTSEMQGFPVHGLIQRRECGFP
jgi:hypothetical protein